MEVQRSIFRRLEERDVTYDYIIVKMAACSHEFRPPLFYYLTSIPVNNCPRLSTQGLFSVDRYSFSIDAFFHYAFVPFA